MAITPSHRCYCLFAIPVLAVALPSQWRGLDGPIDARVVFDTVRQRAVAFGADGGTWEWHGAQRLHRAADGPGQRTGAAMAFDQARNQVLLFGGNVPGRANALGDTWVWDGTAWSQPFQLVNPPRRVDGCMAYDAARARVVLFGGLDAFSPVPRDVWEYDGNQWQRIAVPGPVASFAGLMAYDPVRAEVVYVMLDQANPQTWSWNGSRWASVASSGPTQGNGDQLGMEFDPSRSRMVLLGGTGQIWELQGNSWAPGPVVPALRVIRPSLYFDPNLGAMVIQGGRSNGTAANTSIWTWDGASARQIAPAHSPPRRSNFAAANDPVRGRSILFGGGSSAGERNDLWEWDGQSWLPQAVASGPAGRERAAACFDWYRRVVLVFGGRRFPNVLDELWALEGTGWTQLHPVTVPPPAFGAAMVWDAMQLRVVLFGGHNGQSPSNATWEWDGINWQRRAPVTSPPARCDHAMAYHTVRNRIVLYGGRDSQANPLTDTWEWDGSQWRQVTTLMSPGPATGACMAFDPPSGCIALVRTFTDIQTFRGEIWHYDGTTWTLIDPVPSSDLGSTSLLWDSGRERLLLLDGESVSERSSTPATITLSGQACGSQPPRIMAHTRPRIGQAGFGTELWTGANRPLVWVVGWNAANTPLGNGCTLLVQPVATRFALADARGFALLSLPATTGLHGLTVRFQGAVLDPSAPGGFALSAGLHAVLGD